MPGERRLTSLYLGCCKHYIAKLGKLLHNIILFTRSVVSGCNRGKRNNHQFDVVCPNHHPWNVQTFHNRGEIYSN